MKTLLDTDELVFNRPELGCVLYLTGLPGGNNRLHDISPYGNTGAITGATWVRTPGGLWCLSFDGTDDYIDCGNNGSLNPNKITIEGWAYSDDASPSYRGLAMRGAWDSSYQLYVDGVGLRFLIKNASDGVQTLAVTGLVASTWMHIVATFDGGLPADNLKLFKNRELIGTDDLTGNIKSSAGSTVIGRTGIGESYWDGLLSMVRIYNRPLSALEIQNHYNQEKCLFGVW